MNLLEAKSELQHKPRKIPFSMMGVEAAVMIAVAVLMVEFLAA